MKTWLYLGLVVFAVPLQTTVLGHFSFQRVEPDLVLIAVVLIGLLTGELEGALMGLVLGFVQDLFSAGVAFPNLITKGVLGIAAGLIGRQVVQVTTLVVAVSGLVLSTVSGLAFLYLARGHSPLDALMTVPTLLLPQALLDAALAALVFWLLTSVLPLFTGVAVPVTRMNRF
ncbi:MAG: rod shape-determining protein MreD [Nitrospiraceae bacterium]